MRIIKYRALTNTGWEYGLPFYSHGTGKWKISHSDGWLPTYNDPDQGESTVLIDVKPETITQFTGFYAKKCKTNLENEIYEHDVFRSEIDTDLGTEIQYNVVMWIEQRGAFYLIPACHFNVLMDNDLENDNDFEWLFEDANLYDFSIDVRLTKVGNIYQNPELLK